MRGLNTTSPKFSRDFVGPRLTESLPLYGCQPTLLPQWKGCRGFRTQNQRSVLSPPAAPTRLGEVSRQRRPPPHFTLLSSRAVSRSIFYRSKPSEPFHPTFLCKPSSSPRRSWGWDGMHCGLSRVPIVRKSGPAVNSLTAPGSWPPPLSLQLQKKGNERAHRHPRAPPLPLCARVHAHTYTNSVASSLARNNQAR